MRKTIVYIAILGVLGFGVWYFLFKDTSVFEEDEAGFTITNTADIDRIFLASQQGDTISLQKTADGWLLNNKHKASIRMVETLLQTFKEQYAAYPVPDNAHNGVVKYLAGSGVKVEVYNKKGEAIRVFYVGGQASGNKGTYMLIEGADRPYVVELPAYEGYVTPRYSTEYAAWRNRNIVDLKPEELASVGVQYTFPDELLNSFTMVRTGDGKLDIKLHPELNMSSPVNEKRVKTFAGFFEKVGCEGYLSGVHKLDSLIGAASKYCDLTIVDTKGNESKIAMYKMKVYKRSKNVTDETSLDEFDSDRFYGIINNGRDTVMLQNHTFGKILRRGYEFYQADEK